MKLYTWLGIGFGVVVLSGIIKRKEIMSAWNDLVTNRRIEKLHPSIRAKVKAFIAEAAHQGIFLRVTSGLRDFAEQQTIYDQGRTPESIARGEKIVTNAKPGQSFHNYGLGFDVVEIKDGVGLWENTNWAKIGSIGKSFGFEWGGDWTSFKDLPHFQYPKNTSVATLLAQYNAGKKDSQGYLVTVA